MKTIRNKVFETNSSSTHSISIESNLLYGEIFENGILYLQRLKSCKQDINDDYIIIARTRDEKIAFVISYLLSILEISISESEEYSEYINKIKTMYNISMIDETKYISIYDDDEDYLEIDDMIKAIDNPNINLSYTVFNW